MQMWWEHANRKELPGLELNPEPSEALSQVHGHYAWLVAPIRYRATRARSSEWGLHKTKIKK